MTDKNDHIKKPITLDDIEKKGVFEVNEAYFDNLPSKIQDRVIDLQRKQQPAYIMSRSLKLALPIIALIIMSVYFGNWFSQSDIDVQAMIDEVSTEELVAYLNDSELSTDEILALIDIDELDIDGMLDEDIEFLDDTEFEDILDEYPEYETDF